MEVNSFLDYPEIFNRNSELKDFWKIIKEKTKLKKLKKKIKLEEIKNILLKMLQMKIIILI